MKIRTLTNQIDDSETMHVAAINKKGLLIGNCVVKMDLEIPYIHNLAVQKNYRRNRVATRIIEAILKKAETKGKLGVCTLVDKSNYASRRTFESCGFLVTQDKWQDEQYLMTYSFQMRLL